jgi:signal peptidase
MLPAVWPGDVLEVRRQQAEEVQPGDLVLYERQGRLVAHRVVEKLRRNGGLLLVTRGDRQSAPDLPVSPEEILGRVTGVMHGNRRKMPLLTFWRRVGAWILNRSDFLTRVLVRLSHILSRRSRSEEAQWVG